jgi:small-conductance mechanosensitive channel
MPSADPICRTARRRVACLLLAALALCPAAQAEDAAAPAVAASAPFAGVPQGPAYEPAELVIANRTVVTLRAPALGATPAERVESVEERVSAVVSDGGPLKVATRDIPEGVAVQVDGRLIFRVLNADVDPESGETASHVAKQAAAALQIALDELREVHNSRAILRGIGVTILASAMLALALWLLRRAYAWVAGRLEAFAHRRSERLTQTLGHQLTGQLGLARLVVAPVRLLAVLVGLLAAYEWLGVVLKQFPYTRPWGETLLAKLLAGLGEIVLKAMEAVPGLLFVLFILLIARFFVRVVKAFFEGVAQGRVQVQWVDETTARPTGKLFTTAIWLLALVAAYPYFPGSSSEAFKGIGVFVGLMVSIGSSGVVNQAVSGLMLMYTKSFRPGEFVKVGETEGTVREIGFLTTSIETLRHEHVTIPNAVIVGNVSRNFSRLRERGGVRVPTTLTIGYDTPWRQVQGMLQLAAERTAGIVHDPPPRILQTALLDHAVEYTMLVAIADPTQRPVLLGELHGHILDVFNEYGVQIMSPRYEQDPAAEKLVPRDQWFKAPAPPDAE